MRTLVLDLETAPNIAHVWSIWNVNVEPLKQLRQSGRVISFGAMWHGENKVEFRSDYHDGHDVMIQRAWELIDEADAVVHYNGLSFDMPWLRSEFALAGMTPPAPHKDIDLLRTVKKQFRFPSNKLDYVSRALGLKGKVSHTGHQLWVDCLEGDDAAKAKAWGLMKRYNVGDVRLTDELYTRLKPWLVTPPHFGVFGGRPDCCPRCGGTRLQARGQQVTQVAVYQRLHCQECGSWSRGGKRERAVETRAV